MMPSARMTQGAAAEHITPYDRLALDDGCADRIGALLVLCPGNAGLERDVLGLGQEIGIAHRMQDETFTAAQKHDAARSGELMMKILHHRGGNVDQVAVLADDDAQVCFIDPANFTDAVIGDAEGSAALPGAFNEIRNGPARHSSLGYELSIGATDRRHVGGRLILFHTTSSLPSRFAYATGQE